MARENDESTWSCPEPGPEFWLEQASRLHWHRQPSKAIAVEKSVTKSGIATNTWCWFPDGELSTCFNCVDRHVQEGRGEEVAIFFDSPVTGTKEKFTYQRMQAEVETFAGALRELGVRRGDVVLLYSESRL